MRRSTHTKQAPPTGITTPLHTRRDGWLTRRFGGLSDDFQGQGGGSSAFGGPSIGGGPTKVKPLDWLEEVRRKHYEARQLQGSAEGRRLQVGGLLLSGTTVGWDDGRGPNPHHP